MKRIEKPSIRWRVFNKVLDDSVASAVVSKSTNSLSGSALHGMWCHAASVCTAAFAGAAEGKTIHIVIVFNTLPCSDTTRRMTKRQNMHAEIRIFLPPRS
jgi:hypothetical protein